MTVEPALIRRHCADDERSANRHNDQFRDDTR